MKRVAKTILPLLIALLFTVGCTQRSYIMSFTQSDRSTRTVSKQFSTPSALNAKNQSPERMQSPTSDHSEAKAAQRVPADGGKYESRIVADDRSVATEIEDLTPAASYDHSFSGNETQHVKFSTYDPFGQNGNSFSIDLTAEAAKFTYPIDGKFSSGYGRRGRGTHSGVDLVAPLRTPIYAAFDGTVRLAKPYSGYGNVIVLRHSNGLETVYAHNSKNLVSVGQSVRSGQQIAECGRTGRATTEHLHFEVRVKGQAINPNLLIDAKQKRIQSGTLLVSRSGSGISAKLTGGNNVEQIEEPVVASHSTSNEQADNAAPSMSVSNNKTEIPPANSSITPSVNHSKGVRVGDTIYDAPQQTEQPQNTAKYHTIVSGDTLSTIARKYGTSLSSLCALNNITKNTVIRTGKKLRVK